MKKLNTAPTIGILTVATNIYLDYWKALVLSADLVSSNEDEVVFYVFTEKSLEAKEFAEQLKNVKVKVFPIPGYGWPEATLLRYEIFNSQLDLIDSEILVHLDADMLLNSSPWNRIRQRISENAICLVGHPGFWRPKGSKKLSLYIKYPLLGIQDFRLKIKIGGIGAWETNKLSKSFVSRKSRKDYVCGGTWFGEKEAISDLLISLAQEVRRDQENKVVAIWHDESHINRWSTENLHGFENPELCFDETYHQLKHLTPVITAVRKTVKTR